MLLLKLSQARVELIVSAILDDGIVENVVAVVVSADFLDELLNLGGRISHNRRLVSIEVGLEADQNGCFWLI
jgi:hypothetical protein